MEQNQNKTELKNTSNERRKTKQVIYNITIGIANRNDNYIFAPKEYKYSNKTVARKEFKRLFKSFYANEKNKQKKGHAALATLDKYIYIYDEESQRYELDNIDDIDLLRKEF